MRHRRRRHARKRRKMSKKIAAMLASLRMRRRLSPRMRRSR